MYRSQKFSNEAAKYQAKLEAYQAQFGGDGNNPQQKRVVTIARNRRNLSLRLAAYWGGLESNTGDKNN